MWEYINAILIEKNIPKSFIYKNLGTSAQSLDYKIKNDAFTFNDYKNICELLIIDGGNYFNKDKKGFEITKQYDNLAKEPEIKYGHNKAYNNEKSDLSKLIDQNTHLIAIIAKLTGTDKVQ